MTALVLVHGAWHGAWSWGRVTRALMARGITDVVVPTLTGLGERRDELAPTVGLSTHVDDVVAILDRTARPVVLVGHSYAGLVVREAADRRPDAVARLVLLDAWVGSHGDSLLGLAPAWMVDHVRQAAADSGAGWRIPPPSPALVGVDDPADARWLEAHLTDQPLGTFTDSTILTGAADRVPTWALTAEESLFPFHRWAQEAGWPTTTVPTGHDMMVTAPDAVAAVLATAVDEAAVGGAIVAPGTTGRAQEQ